MAGRLLDGHARASRILGDVATGAIVAWALDELIRGVNTWRRALGGIVSGGSVASIVRRRVDRAKPGTTLTFWSIAPVPSPRVCPSVAGPGGGGMGKEQWSEVNVLW